MRLGKRVLPLRVRDTPIEALPAGLASYQLIPSRQLFEQDFEGSLTQLITEIRTDREWVREHTEWGEKAREWEKHNHDPSYLLSGAELEAASVGGPNQQASSRDSARFTTSSSIPAAPAPPAGCAERGHSSPSRL